MVVSLAEEKLIALTGLIKYEETINKRRIMTRTFVPRTHLLIRDTEFVTRPIYVPAFVCTAPLSFVVYMVVLGRG